MFTANNRYLIWLFSHYIGHTGSGKSTNTQLLFRFYDEQEFHNYIDNQIITVVAQNSMRKATGLDPQDTFLFFFS